MVHGDRFSVFRDWSGPACMALAALGPGFVSGREIAFFYSQTGRASWLGILIAGVLFGLFAGCTAKYARKTAANSFPQIFRRSLGVYAGGTVWVLHGAALALMAVLALKSAAHASALMLPVRNAEILGICIAMAVAAVICKAGQNGWNAVLPVTAVLYIAALWLWGNTPDASRVYQHTKLKLDGSVQAAAVLALLHGCRSAAVSAGVAAGMGRRMPALRLGLWSGMWMILMLAAGNICLMKHPPQVLNMEMPFASMASEWGKGGYYFAAGMQFMCAAMTIAAVLDSVWPALRGKRRNGC